MLLEGKKVAILAENGYHELELFVPFYRLIEEGTEVDIIGINNNTVYKGKLSGYPLNVNKDISTISQDQYDSVVIPGGHSPEYLSVNEDILHFAKDMDEAGKSLQQFVMLDGLLLRLM